MGKKGNDVYELQHALDLSVQYETVTAAANALGIPRKTFAERVARAKAANLVPGKEPQGPLIVQVRQLRAELANAQAEALTRDKIRAKIINLKASVSDLSIPDWTLPPKGPATAPGVPTLFASDFHWAEVVEPGQINGVNEYNMQIAHRRLDSLVVSAEHLLRILSPKMNYPGIVFPLGGDMVTGDIHEELASTNELNIMPTVVDLFGKLVQVITYLADTFGRVFCPCVTGNHGRNTRKTWAKDRHATSFDWLLYMFLAKHFENDQRVTFYIPDGPDAYYRIYEHRYLLTHGDQFRGGDSIIGALGPLTRGNQKKQSRNAQIDMGYDTMVCGHWHQDIFLRRLIVNSSLKGYDEYAYAENFPFEPPSQQLWVTHPKYRITYRMPVQVERQREPAKTSWVAVPQ